MFRAVVRALATVREDIQAVYERDPAAKNLLELLLAYPGLHAIWLHRLAHWLHQAGVPVLPRLISHFNRFITGIEIHPGAKIGRRFFIDHGMGVVIGETAEIGDDVTLYQGVTLGIYHTHAAHKLRGVKRHPTLRDRVTVGVGAKILGAITVGEGATIGSGSVVTKDVPPYTTVMGVPGRVVWETNPETGERRRVDPQPRLVNLPDPELEVIRCLHNKVLELEQRLEALEHRGAGARAEERQGPNGRPAGERNERDAFEAELQRGLRHMEGKPVRE